MQLAKVFLKFLKQHRSAIFVSALQEIRIRFLGGTDANTELRIPYTGQRIPPHESVNLPHFLQTKTVFHRNVVAALYGSMSIEDVSKEEQPPVMKKDVRYCIRLNWIELSSFHSYVAGRPGMKAVEKAWMTIAALNTEQQVKHDERNYKTGVVSYKTSAKLV